jgi:hypothetical protein
MHRCPPPGNAGIARREARAGIRRADGARPAYVRGTREDEGLSVSLRALVCAAWLCGDVVASRVVRADSLA